MNGNEQQILDAVIDNGNRLTAIEAKQEERHNTNVENMEKLHKTIANVVRLKTHVGIQWYFIGAIFLGLVALFIRGLNA